MDNINNPYTPNAGAAPEVLIGRDGQTEAFSILLQRLKRGRTEQSMIMTGLRGVGKTVLLNRFAELAELAGWESIELEASKHDETAFRQSIFSKFRAALHSVSPSSPSFAQHSYTYHLVAAGANALDTPQKYSAPLCYRSTNPALFPSHGT